jgi:hypothetical protein
MIFEISPKDRHYLKDIFENCNYDKVLIQSILEGGNGNSYADSVQNPKVARLDIGAFTIIAGDCTIKETKELFEIEKRIDYITPQNIEWEKFIKNYYDNKINTIEFISYNHEFIKEEYLEETIKKLPQEYIIKRIDRSLAERLKKEIGNEYFFENYISIEDFLEKGIGYCILHNEEIVSAALSMASAKKAIDIEIETVEKYRNKKLGKIIGAKLIKYCLEEDIIPYWLAANEISNKLALSLGYIEKERYKTFEIL